MLRKITSLLLVLMLLVSAVTVTSLTAIATSAPGNPELARKAAGEGMVLLENDGVLPLAGGAKVALFGRYHINLIKGGGGSGDVTTAYVRNVLYGMQQKQTAGKVALNAYLVNQYATNSGLTSNDNNVTQAIVDEAAKDSDIAIVTLGRTSAEGSDRTSAAGSYLLSANETNMLTRINNTFNKVVVVMNICGVTDMAWIKNFNHISAVLIAWLPGMEGGNAIADVLCGDVNPSGKLVDTFANTYADYPASTNFGSSSRVTYREDIYVGYRYFETVDPTYQKVQYEFGYGKSYSTFDITNKAVTIDGNDLVATATVKNNGPYPGKEVLQTYFSAPAGLLNKPGKELAAFAKTKLLAVGESQTLTMRFPIADMAAYDDLGKTGKKSANVLEAGDYAVYIGNSIKNAGQSGVIYKYNVPALRVVEQLTEQLSPVTRFQRLIDPVTNQTEDVGPPAPVHNIAATGNTVIKAPETNTATAEVRYETVPNSTDKCVAFFNNGNEITYKLNVAQAGTYNIVLRYALGRAALNNILDFYVNGTLQPGNTVNMVQTGDGDGQGEWYNFIDSPAYRITLPAGECSLMLKSKGSAGNLLTYTLSPATAPIIAPFAASAATKPTATLGSIFDGNKGMQLLEVYNDPSKMGAFMNQLTDDDLIYLAQGHGATVGGGTGTIGSLLKYGIPPMDTADGPAGIRLSTNCTMWPMGTLMACTWDVDLVQEVGRAIGVEAALNGVEVWLAPGMNIHRDPLCGRNFEYYSEDPLLTGKIAAAITKGVQSEGIGITIKHYAANNQETNRSGVDTLVSERAMREIYLKGFEIAVKEAEPWCVMTSYNLLNGTETAERYDLVTTILCEEWGFKGFVMTDWGNNSNHAREEMAGNAVKMASGDTAGLKAALAAGTLTRAQLERNIKLVLNVIMKSKAFAKLIEDPHYYDPKIHQIAETGVTKVKAAEFAETTGAPRPESCSDTDGGQNMGYLDAGGTITYYFNVQRGGVYDVLFRTAANASPYGQYGILVDGVKVATVKPVNTGGWQNWRTLEAVKIPLPAGEHFFKINIEASGSNLNWMQFDLATPATTIAFTKTPVVVNEVFGIKVECPTDVKGIAIANEDNMPVTIKNLAASVSGKIQTFTANASLGTAGTRKLKVLLDYGDGNGYVDSGAIGTIDVTKTAEAPKVLSVVTPTNVLVNVAANYTITNNAEGSYSANLRAGGTSSNLGKTVVSKTINPDGTFTWVLSVKIGTAGTNRAFEAYAGNANGMLSDPYKFNMTVKLF